MILEHEIPKGSKLYFGESAKLKRLIENTAAQILEDAGFNEISSPLFSYHQHMALDEGALIRFSDKENRTLSLRADSTMDVVRLITKRVDKSAEAKKWFYIQPIFRYPSFEYHQVGAEIIGEDDIAKVIALTLDTFEKLELNPILQLSNIAIPKLVSKMTGLSIDVFQNLDLEKILALNEPWLEKLVRLHTVEDLKMQIDAPREIQIEIDKIAQVASSLNYSNIAISPLYYADMRYYKDVFFRLFQDNSALAVGGSYAIDKHDAVGFALYSDNIIEQKMEK